MAVPRACLKTGEILVFGQERVLQRKNARRTAVFPDFLTPKPSFLVKTDLISAFSSRILKPAPVNGARSGCQPLLDSLAAAPLCARADQHFCPEAAGRLSKEGRRSPSFCGQGCEAFQNLDNKRKMSANTNGRKRRRTGAAGKSAAWNGRRTRGRIKGPDSPDRYYYYYA